MCLHCWEFQIYRVGWEDENGYINCYMKIKNGWEHCGEPFQILKIEDGRKVVDMNLVYKIYDLDN
jgi:hypothetical protein